MRVLKVCCTKTICQACDVQMELRGHDNCPFCRSEPMSPADELAKLEHWAAKDSAAAVCQLGYARPCPHAVDATRRHRRDTIDAPASSRHRRDAIDA